jgi:hypothetical protein
MLLTPCYRREVANAIAQIPLSCPAIIHPPSGGDWNVVIDDAGEVTAAVQVAN